MNHKITTLFAGLSLLIFACSPKSTPEVETIILDYSGKTSVYQYDRIESIGLIPLQTDNTCMIGASPTPKIVDDNLIIMHGDNYLRIDRYNTHGAHLNQIGRIGRGPGEFVGLISDCFLYDHNMIGVHVYGKNSILLYDFNGDFVREVLYDPTAFLVHGQGSNFWALMPPKTDSPRLICLSETGEEISSMLLSKKTYPAPADLWWPFHLTNGTLYIGMPYDNAIYKAEQDKISTAFLIDAGKYRIPDEFYNDPFKVFASLNQNGYAAVYNFLESTDYYVIQIVVRGETESLIWGIKFKQEEAWFWSKIENYASDALEYPKAELTDDNRLMFLIPPPELREQLPFMKNVYNQQVVSSLDDNDNPVLVELRLK